MSTDAGRVREATVRLPNGLRVHYAEHGDADGEPVLFLHGYTDSWFSFSRLLPRLPLQHHAFAFDQRGHGDSDRPECCYAVDDLVGDVVAFIDTVGAGQVTLVGHSGGSFTARRVAQRHPELVRRLVLMATAPDIRTEPARQLHAAVHALDDPVPTDFVREFQLGTTHVDLPQPFVERVVAESLKLPARLWQRVLDGLFAIDDAADLHRIAAPTLVLWGDRDQMFGRTEQDALVAAIPKARLVVYPETGHAIHWERPERVADDLSAFMLEA